MILVINIHNMTNFGMSLVLANLWDCGTHQESNWSACCRFGAVRTRKHKRLLNESGKQVRNEKLRESLDNQKRSAAAAATFLPRKLWLNWL